jgi:flavin reductase (DIM6/NTAB) family NADH-FMN oxidoreductase RutF
MKRSISETELVNLEVDQKLWEHFFIIAPLIIVGTKEEDGTYDLAAKHQCTPLGWSNYFGFVCTPRHSTYHNIKREKVFTVNFPNPDQVILTSLSAAPRCEDHSKPSLAVLPTFPATVVDGVLLKDAYLYLECELDQIIDGFGENSLITGKIVAAAVQNKALRLSGLDDQDLLTKAPLLAYLSPGRYAKIDHSNSFPFHSGFNK